MTSLECDRTEAIATVEEDDRPAFCLGFEPRPLDPDEEPDGFCACRGCRREHRRRRYQLERLEKQAMALGLRDYDDVPDQLPSDRIAPLREVVQNVRRTELAWRHQGPARVGTEIPDGSFDDLSHEVRSLRMDLGALLRGRAAPSHKKNFVFRQVWFMRDMGIYRRHKRMIQRWTCSRCAERFAGETPRREHQCIDCYVETQVERRLDGRTGLTIGGGAS